MLQINQKQSTCREKKIDSSWYVTDVTFRMFQVVVEEEAAVQQPLVVEVVVAVVLLLLEEAEEEELLQVEAEEVEEEGVCFSLSSVDLHRLTNQSIPDIPYVGFPWAWLCTLCWILCIILSRYRSGLYLRLMMCAFSFSSDHQNCRKCFFLLIWVDLDYDQKVPL